MSVFLMRSMGKNDSHTAVWNLFQNGNLLRERVPYKEAHDLTLELSRPGDIYQEECGGEMYCNISIEKLWEGQVEIETKFGHGKEIKEWHAKKLAGQ